MDIYDDLDNYEELNNYEQLKNENQELKHKLQEYEISVQNLKKELDNLSSEHKRLMVNYSSLLRTARAEIERKTDTITQINAEKDKLFLRLVSNNRGQNPGQFRTFVPNFKENCDNSSVKSRLSRPHDRIHEQQRLTLQNDKDLHIGSEKSTEIKNDKENLLNDVEKPMSIACRRKSLPAFRQEPKFSSDEEGEILSLCDSDKLSNTDKSKVSVTSSNEDRYPSTTTTKESSKERYISSRIVKVNKPESIGHYREAEDDYRYRGRETKRNERFRGRPSKRDYRDDRRDYSPHRSRSGRILHSPPRDRYYRTRSRDRRHYDRDEPKRHEKERTDRLLDRRPEYEKPKYNRKSYEDSDEPARKKPRNDPLALNHEKASISHENATLGHEKFAHNKDKLSLIEGEVNANSCRSPDDIVHDRGDDVPPIKEIMNTAKMRLEDPRLASNRYVKVLDRWKKPCFIAKHGVDVDLILLRPWANKEVVLYKNPPESLTDPSPSLYNYDFDPLPDSHEDTDPVDDLLFTYSDSRPQSYIEKKHVSNPVDNTKSHQETASVACEFSVKKYKIPKKIDRKSTDRIDSEVKSQKCLNPLDIMYRDLLNSSAQDKNETDKTSACETKHASKDENIETHYEDEHRISLGIVEKDLALSDDASGNVDQSHSITDKSEPMNTSEALQPSKKEMNMMKESKRSKEIEQPPDNHRNHKDEKKKNEEPKEKVKKVTKSKSRTRSETKSNDKEEALNKHKDIHEKFSDLFGDSSSLITPEDLDIPVIKSYQGNNPDATIDKGKHKDKGETSIASQVKDFSNISFDNAFDSDLKSTLQSQSKDMVHKGFEKVHSRDHKVRINPVNIITDTSRINEPKKDLTTIVISSGCQNSIMPAQEPKIVHREGLSKGVVTSTPEPKQQDVAASNRNLVDDSSRNDSDCNRSNISDGSATIPGDVPDVKIVLKRKRRVVKR